MARDLLEKVAKQLDEDDKALGGVTPLARALRKLKALPRVTQQPLPEELPPQEQVRRPIPERALGFLEAFAKETPFHPQYWKTPAERERLTQLQFLEDFARQQGIENPREWAERLYATPQAKEVIMRAYKPGEEGMRLPTLPSLGVGEQLTPGERFVGEWIAPAAALSWLPTAVAGWKAAAKLPTVAKIAARIPLAPLVGAEVATGAILKYGIAVPLKGIPVAARKAFELALDAGLDKWLATQGRIGEAGNVFLRKSLTKENLTKLTEFATNNWLRRRAEAKAQKQGIEWVARNAADDTIKNIEPLLLKAGKVTPVTPEVTITLRPVVAGSPEILGDISKGGKVVGWFAGRTTKDEFRIALLNIESPGTVNKQFIGDFLSSIEEEARTRGLKTIVAVDPSNISVYKALGFVESGKGEFRKSIGTAIPKAEVGMPEAGIQPSMIEELEAQVTEVPVAPAVEEVAPVIPLPSAGGVPPKPPKDWNKVKGSLWNRYNKYLPESTPTVRPPLRETLTKAYRKGEQFVADEYAHLNKLGWETELNAAMVRASPGRAAEVYRQTMVGIEKALGGNNNLIKDVDNYLMLRHQLEVIKATGRKTFALVKGGKITRFTEKQIGLLFAQMKDTLGDKYELVKQAASVVPKAYHELLRESSEVTPEVAEMLIKKYPWYNPIIYEQEGGQVVTNLSKLSPNMIKQLTQYNVDKQPITPLTTLPNAIKRRLTANALNDAKKAIAHNALGTTEWGGKVEIVDKKPEGAFIDFFENGIRKYLKLGKGAEWIAKDVELFKTQPKDAVRRVAKAINAVSRATFTTFSPAFIVSNSIFDTLTTWFREGIKPWEIGQAAYHTVADIFIEDAVVNRFRAAGADVGGFFFDEKTLTREFIKAGKTGNITIRNPKSTIELLKRYSNLFMLIKDLGHAGENAPRLATFKKALKEGLSESGAALRGRRVTVDFARMSLASKVINDYYLFFNAGVQGFLLPGRTLRDNPKSIMRLALFLSATIGLTAYNLSYDEYKDVPDSLKYGSLLIMLPSTKYDKYGKKVPKYITIIPTLREFSVFTAPVVYMLGKLSSKQPELYSSLSEAFGYWYPTWSPISMITGTAGIEIPTQLGQTLNELFSNRDTYRNVPIIDDEMAQLPPKEQYDEYTSKLAITIGQALNQSPKKFDFFINNMFGSTGRDAMYAISQAIEAIDGELADPRITGLVKQLREIPIKVKPSEIAIAREEFLNKLSVEDRDVVLSMERIPDDKIPFISTTIYRLYKERGGQVYQTAKQKALTEGELETPQKALEGLQESAVSNAEKYIAGKMSKEQYDKERTRYRAYYSGARTEEWRQARLKGAVGISDIEKFMPKGWQRGKEEQALSAYYEIQDKYISKTEVLDSNAWKRIMKSTEQDLREKYPEDAVKYALTHVNDWIYNLPEPARSLELKRLQEIASGLWWMNYRKGSLGGGGVDTGWGGTLESALEKLRGLSKP